MALPEIWTAALGFGFVLGLRHALEPDHIVAVSNIVSTSRDLRRSSLVGTYWGLGHTAALFAAGIAVIGMKLTIPKNLALWMELAVAAMLCALGWQTILQARKRLQDRRRNPNAHSHEHSHDQD